MYTVFTTDDVIANQEETVTRAMFSGNIGNYLTYYTSSDQTATQKTYYYEIFNSASSSPTSEAQFSIAYGHRAGSGSSDPGGQVNDTPSRAIYSQYRQLCLNPGSTGFNIDSRVSTHIFAINFNRARMKDKIDEGNLEINIHALSGSQFIAGGGTNAAHTGSNVTLGAATAVRLIDDSIITTANFTTAGEEYNLVSGSIESGVYNSSAPHYYGKMYPRLGIAIIDAEKLNESASFSVVTGSGIDGDNALKLFTAMSGAAANLTDGSGDALGMSARSAEKVKSTHYFVRAKNTQYNYSNNPTFVTGSDGSLSQPTFINDPKVYITTIGMYNSNRECLAVAKLSKPLLKSFTKEALIKVKLDY